MRTRDEKVRKGKIIKWVILIVCLLFGIRVFSPQINIYRAEKLIKAGKYDEAIILLEQVINGIPTNAKLRLSLGKCKLLTGEIEQAEESFAGAVRLNPAIKTEVGKLFLDQAKKSSDDYQINRFLQLAVQYDQTNSGVVAEILLTNAQRCFGDEEYRRGSEIIESAVEYNPAIRTKVGKLFLEQAEKTSDDNQINHFLQLAVQYDQTNSKPAAEILLVNGRKHLDSGKYSEGLSVIALAVKYDPEIKTKTGKLFLEEAKKISDDHTNHFLQLAVQYDKTNNRPAAETLLVNTRKYFESREYQKGLDAISLAREFDQSIDKTAGEVILTALKELKGDTPPDIVKTLITEAIKISPDLISKIQEYTLTNAKKFLRQNKPALAITQLEIMIDTGINNQQTKELFLTCLNELIENAPDDFRKGMELLLKTYPEITQSENPMTRYLYGVHLWQLGYKEQALITFKTVANGVNMECLDFVLKPIPTGEYPVNQSIEQPEQYLGYLEGKNGNVMLTIASVEVPSSQDSIVVNLSVRNHTYKKQNFIFPRNLAEKETRLKRIQKALSSPESEKREIERRLRSQPQRRSRQQSTREPLGDFSESDLDRAAEAVKTNTDFYLIDDLGNKVNSINKAPYFRRSPNWQENPDHFYANEITIEAGEQISEKIAFSMVSLGATAIKFGLPEQPVGWDNETKEVSFKPVVLREIKFTRFPTN